MLRCNNYSYQGNKTLKFTIQHSCKAKLAKNIDPCGCEISPLPFKEIKHFQKIPVHQFQLARACGVLVGWRSSSRLAMTLVATKNDIFFFSFLFPSSTFLIEGALGSKNLFRES